MAIVLPDPLCGRPIPSLGYYCNEPGLGLSTCVFYKALGPRVWIGDDPLPDPSVYDTKDHLKNERVV